MQTANPNQVLREEFRILLEKFYRHLNLAPPYHSIEKAIQHLANTLRTEAPEIRQRILHDSERKWALYREIFEASGLSRKHRGIIRPIAQTASKSSMTDESLRFLSFFTD